MIILTKKQQYNILIIQGNRIIIQRIKKITNISNLSELEFENGILCYSEIYNFINK